MSYCNCHYEDICIKKRKSASDVRRHIQTQHKMVIAESLSINILNYRQNVEANIFLILGKKLKTYQP